MSEHYKNISGEMCDFHAYYDNIAGKLKNNCKVVEVGVADGHSAIYLAEKLQALGKDFKMVLIDSMDYGGDDQWGTIMRNVYLSGLWEKITIYKLSSLDGSCKIVDQWADFVFIDASHQYDQTKGDARVWYHKVQPRWGILAGHDMTSDEWPGVAQAINECFKPEYIKVIETDKNYGIWEIERSPGAYQLNTDA